MFANREDAGEQLARVLQGILLPKSFVVLGIPRGGIVVAATIAKRVHMPLGYVLVKKIGAPYNPELAIGAVGEGEIVYWDHEVLERAQLGEGEKRVLQEQAQHIVSRREQQYAPWCTRPDLTNKAVLLVDDGIATGATAICAAAVAKYLGAETVLLVTPIIPSDVVPRVRSYVSEIITLETANTFTSVGSFYASFPEVTDEEIQHIFLSREQHHSKHLQT